MSDSSKKQQPEHRVRWGLISLVTVIGLAVTATPFVLSWRGARGFGNWRALSSGTLTNVGTSLLLVAAIWFLERRFTARITVAVQETTRAAVAEETTELVASQRDLSLRLDDLQSRLDDRVAQTSQQQDEVIRRLADGISYESVRDALAQADALGALWFHEVTIPAGDGEPQMPRFVFRWGNTPSGPWLEELLSDEDDSPRLTVTHDEKTIDGKRVRVVWGLSNTADEVLSELRQGMMSAGFAEQSKQVDATIFSNLHAAIREAVAGRRADSGAWLKGALDEWITEDWAVTHYGLEHRGPYGMRSGEFPVHWDGRSNEAARTWKQPPTPDAIDDQPWDFMIRRARRRHREGVPLRV